MKTEEEQRHYRVPGKPAEPKLRRVRKKFFSKKYILFCNAIAYKIKKIYLCIVTIKTKKI